MNPRLFCRERTFHKALLLTYSFDPVFFEQIVLPDLWAGRASDILVIGDKNQVETAIQSAVGQLWHLGKRYLLGNAKHTGSFHPKVLLRLGAKDGAVMIGSGNLTSCGWSSNRELGCAWMLGPGHPDRGDWLHPFLGEVITWCSSDLEKDAVRRMTDVPWLGMGSANSSSSTPVLFSSGNRALAPALAQRWSGRQFSEVRIFTGSTDESGAFLRWAHRTFGIERAIIALTPSLASFSLEKLMDLPLELRLIPVTPTTPMHAKFYYFDGPGGSAALMGSPNCSAAAWLLPPDQSGNIETVLVYDAPQPADFHALLQTFESPSSSPEEVLTKTKPPAAQADPSKCPNDLAGLRWDASSHRVMALIAPPPEPGTAVALLLGATQIAMQFSNIQGDDCWFSDVVEQWLRDLPLAPKSKVHVRNVLHVLYECAIRWELIGDNPISRVRQGGARLAEPEVMSAPEFQALLSEMKQGPYRVMIILAGCLGLGRSEFTGLKWLDFNWDDATLTISRGVVSNHVGNPKTLARRKPVPLAAELIRVLQEWRGQTPYAADSDWVFASSYKGGELPYWPDSVLKRIIQPAAKRAGLVKVVGWHTFRHSYSCLLRANHTDVKVQQELLRHSNIATTMNVYTQAVSEQKRAAHGQVVEQLLAV